MAVKHVVCIRTTSVNLLSYFIFQTGPAVEYLIHSYPEFVTIDSLPLATLDEKVSFFKIIIS